MSRLANLFRLVLRRIDPVLVPRQNRRFNAAALADLSAFRAKVEAAIDRGIKYFEPQRDVEMSALYMLTRLHRYGLEPRLAFMETLVSDYMSRYNNPHWRYFDHEYDPWTDRALSLTQQIPSHPIEVLMLKCLYADRLGYGEELLWDLAETDDSGGYGTTHIVAGGLVLKTFSDIPASRIDGLLKAGIPAMLREQKIGRAGDLFAERIMILQWLDVHEQIDLAWIMRIVDAQNPDGGWPGRVSLRRHVSNQHTACVALAALIQFHAFYYLGVRHSGKI